jgi:sugar (pentulose or hexulose) kinase
VDTPAVAALAKGGITTGWHVLADHWCLLGGTQGGLALQRVLGLLGYASGDLADLDREALSRTANTLTITGVETDELHISGITNGIGPANLWRAALEAVTAQAQQVHSAMSAVVGGHQALVVTGGWSRSEALLEVKRRVLGPLRSPAVSEAGARGAALLAGMAAGVYAGREQFPPLG